MSQTPSTIARSVLAAAWRRRRLVLLPMLVILVAGSLYAKLAPRSYVAKSLLLLQETARDYPLAREFSGSTRMQERIVGLQALLKSERVLSAVMSDIAGDDVLGEHRKAAGWLKDFPNRLSLELVGNDFLELRLKGAQPQGLAKQLNAVTARFFEALLSSQDALSATQVLLDTMKSKVDAAEDSFAQFKQQNGGRLNKSLMAELKQLDDLNLQIEAREKELLAAGSELEALRKQGAQDKDASQSGRKSGSGSAAVKESEARYAALSSAFEQLRRKRDTLHVQIRDAREIDRTLKALEADVATARQNYNDYTQRFVIPAGAKTAGLLAAPERIRLIDPPVDPESPERSARNILIGALLASLLAAAAIIVVAEMFDTTIRRASDIEAMTGAPIIARLPAA